MKLTLEDIKNFYEEEGDTLLSGRYVVDPGTLGLHYLIKTCFDDIKDKIILDLGCGLGLNAISLNFGGAKTIGIDIAKSKLIKAKRVIDVVHATGEHLPIKDKSIDITLCSEILEHVIYPESILQEILRVTKDYAILSFPSCTSPVGRLKNLISSFRRENKNNDTILTKGSSGHLRTISYSQFKKWAKEYDFKILEARGYEIICETSGRNKVITALNVCLSYLPFSRYFGTFLVVKISKIRN